MQKMLISALLFSLLVGGSVQAQTLQIEGSTTVGPIADAFAEYFKRVYPDLNITVKKTGSGDGAAALADGRCDIATMSRFMKDKEFKDAVGNGVYPVAHVVAMDGVCVVVHPSNPVGALTTAQIRDIYAGKITNWSQVGGPSMPIVVISRDTSSGTYETFDEIVMAKQPMGPGVEYVNANPQAHARVKTTQGAIGYVGIGFLDREVKAIMVDQVAPNRQTIASGVYPVARPLFLFTNGYPKLGSMVHRFCAFYLTEKGQELVEAKGFVPLTAY
ncbi:phosphate ABC transporter substrate-binding protein [Anaerobaca lacustris]|uniref:Phosphate-binding protein n=1 Tax=Anaerobaca lacustris TaxID=3044600 RepID=A0AAW6TTR0_9BACT|nr:phosphate ABC transporter substrate-binding protein [Sedimentisphaerales bacterium M17dextr]